MTFPSVHRLDANREKRLAIKMAIILTSVCFVLALIAFVTQENRGFHDGEWVPYFVGAFIFDGLALLILFNHTRGQIKHYKLQLLDEDNFVITDSRGTKKYSPTNITTIEFYKTGIRAVNLREGRYPANIPDNMENYPIVLEYFTKMAKRLGNGVWPQQ